MTQRQAPYNIGKPPRIDEHQEQASFVSEVKTEFWNRDDFISVLFFANPNGMWAGGSSKAGTYALIAKLKAEGFRNGIADLLYLQPRGDYAYLAIEMKAKDRACEKDGGVSAEQREFLEAVNANGGTGEVCYGADDAMKIFRWYMGLPVKD